MRGSEFATKQAKETQRAARHETNQQAKQALTREAANHTQTARHRRNMGD